ncbi:hypothetical protein ST201phi2-1p376 [Pseudomonas phage 201phi2-1]|uniref:Uncharacterized protein n=1 Tax=Pseudomonas phage 201phi2-1 TaxID=198110 RepID=B3FJN6_BP201|nr:hypothetical protein ST201phi2-1p376 [Pseudomonas phage 201phi2-1]ABY63201.1 hypothetical protein 201phi2-1p376 [Pseudomonas phage 201phi2-1]
MSVDNFIGAVKVKRDEAVEHFLSEDFHQAMANGVEEPEAVVRKGIDQLVGGILDVISEQYEDIVTAEDSEGESVSVTVASDLSTLYFEEVSN